MEVILGPDHPLDSLQIVLPFYEGLLLPNPPVVLRRAGLLQLELAYPGVLSAPFVAWRSGDEPWTALGADSSLETPVAVQLRAQRDHFAIVLRPAAPCEVLRVRVQGAWQDLAKALRQRWDLPPDGAPLSRAFDGICFYVHQWISAQDDPALRIDWTIDELVQRMRGERPGTVQHVYGFDPGGVDLGGEYFWSTSALAKVRAVLGANPRLAHLAWLNLRTYKYAIPRLGLERPLTPQVLAGARRCSSGPPARERQYAYELIEMCLASREWQQSRLYQFDRLANLGFRIIQLDEFPAPRRWDLAPCLATGHLHRPGDAAGEWRETLRFVDVLARRARQRGIPLICEEPSAALLCYACGYVDRQFNQASDLYSIWNGSPPARPIPLFSTMYGCRATPCTDIDPDRQPPSGWLVNRKQMRPSRRGTTTTVAPPRTSRFPPRHPRTSAGAVGGGRWETPCGPWSRGRTRTSPASGTGC